MELADEAVQDTGLLHVCGGDFIHQGFDGGGSERELTRFYARPPLLCTASGNSIAYFLMYIKSFLQLSGKLSLGTRFAEFSWKRLQPIDFQGKICYAFSDT
jgi:hypothetical protein